MRYFKINMDQVQRIWQSAEKMGGKRALVVFDTLRSLEEIPQIPEESKIEESVAPAQS